MLAGNCVRSMAAPRLDWDTWGRCAGRRKAAGYDTGAGGTLRTTETPRSLPGRGWFLAGTILLALAGAAHTAGQFTPEEPELAAGLAAMRTARLPMGMGMAPSLWDIFRDLAFTMSVTFFALAAMNLVVVRHRDTTPALLRAVTLLNLAWVAAFIVVCYVYRVPPPLISGGLIWPFFLVAWLRNR